MLADKVAMSRSQLHRKLKAIVGYGPGELIRNFRLQRAADLLRKKTATVSEIAYEVGFSNLSYFAKLFKEKYSVNPSDF
jgi:AraC-like DNA-binding protein